MIPGPLTSNFFFTNAEDTGYLTFAGLTDGQEYELQLVLADARWLWIDIYVDQTDFDWVTPQVPGAGDLADFNYGCSCQPSTEDGSIITATFTGDATGTQSMYLIVNDFDGFPGTFNALQLRAVPEPSSFVISGLGALCLGISGRRRKK
jgi:hypothetical protein